MSEIKPGDVVKLKSGSKPMTVERIQSGDAFVVSERDGKIDKQHVALVALEPAKPSTGGVNVTAMVI